MDDPLTSLPSSVQLDIATLLAKPATLAERFRHDPIVRLPNVRLELSGKLYRDRERDKQTLQPETESKTDPGRRRIDDVRHDIEELLAIALGHLAANPSRRGNVKSLELAYAFANTRNAPGIPVEYSSPNVSEADTYKFIRELADSAHNARRMYAADKGLASDALGSQDLSTAKLRLRAKHLLLGEKGVGKTIYLNYILSAKHKYFNEHRVIFVRVDYTKDGILDLYDRFYWQLCRVVLSYYDSRAYLTALDKHQRDPERSDVDIENWDSKLSHRVIFDLEEGNDKLYHWAKATDPSLSREEFNSQFRRYAAILRTKETPEKLPAWFTQAVFDHIVLDHEVAFLIVIDGLDQLGLTREDKTLFEQRVADTRVVVSNEKLYYVAFLITMRYHTYKIYFTNQQFARAFRLHVVSIVSAYDIWKKKLDLLKNGQSLFLVRGNNNLMRLKRNVYAPAVKDVCKILARLISISLASSFGSERAAADTRLGFSALEGLFGSDRRSLFLALPRVARFVFAHHGQIFEKAFDRLLAAGNLELLPEVVSDVDFETEWRDLRRYHYLVIEALMLKTENSRYCEPLYSFRWSADDRVVFERVEASVPILPNLFNCPFRAGRDWPMEFLAGVRIVQFLTFDGVWERRRLVEVLNKGFGYTAEVCEAILDSFIQDGLVTFATEVGTGLDDLKVTPRGAFCIDRLLYVVEYVHLALQCSPIPLSIIERCFPALPYGPLFSIVGNKFTSVINFCRLVQYIEDVERERFNLYSRSLGGALGDFDKYGGSNLQASFSISDRLRAMCTRILPRIADAARASGNSHLLRTIVGSLRDQTNKRWDIEIG